MDLSLLNDGALVTASAARLHMSKQIEQELRAILPADWDGSECVVHHHQDGTELFLYRGRTIMKVSPLETETIHEDGKIKFVMSRRCTRIKT